MNYQNFPAPSPIDFPAGDPQPEQVISDLINAIEREYIDSEYRRALLAAARQFEKDINRINDEFLV